MTKLNNLTNVNPVALKDVQGNFHNNLKSRLINPVKPEIETIIKSAIEKINDNIKNSNKHKPTAKLASSNYMV